MTRGKLVLITPGGVYETNEFNGDMDIESVGAEAYSLLYAVSNERDLHDAAVTLNEEYEYAKEEIDIYRCGSADKGLDLRTNYIGNWFSDYLYVKNASANDVYVLCKTDEIVMHPSDIRVFRFGKALSNEEVIDALRASTEMWPDVYMERAISGTCLQAAFEKIARAKQEIEDLDHGILNGTVSALSMFEGLLIDLRKQTMEEPVCEEAAYE